MFPMPRPRVWFPLRLLGFWLLLFTLFRLLFMVFYLSHFEGTGGHIAYALIAGLGVDIATGCLLMLPTLILWGIYIFSEKIRLEKTIRIIHESLIVLVVLIMVLNLILYSTWGTLPDKQLLAYLKNPFLLGEAIGTGELLLLPVTLIGMSWLGIRLSRTLIEIFPPRCSTFRKIASLCIVTLLLTAGLKAGQYHIPVTESGVCYSNCAANNDLAINPLFYFGQSLSGLL